MHCASLSLFRFGGLAARAWVLGQMGLARLTCRASRGLHVLEALRFGHGRGVHPEPEQGRLGDPGRLARARRIARARVDTPRSGRAGAPMPRKAGPSSCRPLAARGTWAGVNPFEGEPAAAPGRRSAERGPIAALTRATSARAMALQFWGRVPDISAAIGADPNVAFKIGIGEVPLMHQVTFSSGPMPPHGPFRPRRRPPWPRHQGRARRGLVQGRALRPLPRPGGYGHMERRRACSPHWRSPHEATLPLLGHRRAGGHETGARPDGDRPRHWRRSGLRRPGHRKIHRRPRAGRAAAPIEAIEGCPVNSARAEDCARTGPR